MRNNPNLHERHLLEATRQRVISHDQYEGILAIARSMAHAEGSLSPDVGWIAFMQAGAAAVAVGMPGVFLLDHMRRLSNPEIVAWSMVCGAISLVAGMLFRKRSSATIAGGVLIAAAVAFSWGLFAGSAAALLQTDFGYFGGSDVAGSARRLDTLLFADVGLMVVAALVTWRMKVPVAAAPGAMAFVHFVVECAHRFVVAPSAYFGDRAIAPWVALAGVLLVASARAMDMRRRDREDTAFWVHGVGILAIGFALTTRIDRDHEEATVWSLLALATMTLGLWWNRRVYLACGAMAWLAWPAMGVSRHYATETQLFVFVFTAVTLAVFATWFRKRWIALALAKPERNELRTVWG